MELFEQWIFLIIAWYSSFILAGTAEIGLFFCDTRMTLFSYASL